MVQLAEERSTKCVMPNGVVGGGPFRPSAEVDPRVETILAWIAAPDDGRPLELLRTGPVPTWARECEAILALPAQDLSCVLFTARAALRANVHPAAGNEPG
ncbi:hypothetical protein OG311_40405 (plasmid) [Streptomyces sp. NBC_01343]|uniref:hypothetical protein n=1 Tax=Streptomyces sp. NBC_01343 TaxID=2903832 RepID=UPI002E1190A5|nr:hypothetical protein OG311_40405 [Streptomyces sp. NBC_01343]